MDRKPTTIRVQCTCCEAVLTVDKASGEVVFTTGDRSMAAGSIEKAIIVIGNQNQVRVETSETAYERLREQVFPKPSGIAPP